MNACIIRHSYYPQVPPTQRNAETLTSHGYNVDVICLRKKGQLSREIINGVTVHRLPIEHIRGGKLRYIYEYSFFFILAAWRLCMLALKRKYRVVEVDSMPDFLVFATLPVKLWGTKIVLNMLDSISQVFSHTYKLTGSNLIIKLFKQIERCSIGYADHILFSNDWYNPRYLKKTGRGNPKISVVMNVPDEKLFYIRPSTEQDDRFRLMTHGSLLERYGVHTLIQAVPLLIPSIPEIDVTIVGDGEYRPDLQKMVTDLGIEKHVHFTGFVPITTIPDLIAKTEIGIVPILMHMQPTKLFEYIAMGKPVIASDFLAMRGCFGDDCVCYYKPGDVRGLADCVLELYRNPEKRSALVRSAYSTYQKCRWDVMKNVYTGVFDYLTKKDKTVNPHPAHD